MEAQVKAAQRYALLLCALVVAVASPRALAVSPGNGTLLAGMTLSENESLCSPDGTVCLVPQGDGNLVLYNQTLVDQYGASAATAIFYTGTYDAAQNGHPPPYLLSMQGDCNLVFYDGNAPTIGYSQQTAVFYTATYGQGPQPCELQVCSMLGGYFAVFAANGALIFQRPVTVPPPTRDMCMMSSTPPPSTSVPSSSTLAPRSSTPAPSTSVAPPTTLTPPSTTPATSTSVAPPTTMTPPSTTPATSTSAAPPTTLTPPSTTPAASTSVTPPTTVMPPSTTPAASTSATPPTTVTPPSTTPAASTSAAPPTTVTPPSTTPAASTSVPPPTTVTPRSSTPATSASVAPPTTVTPPSTTPATSASVAPPTTVTPPSTTPASSTSKPPPTTVTPPLTTLAASTTKPPVTTLTPPSTAPSSLYPFTNITFGTCGAVGKLGPANSGTCAPSYAPYGAWTANPAFLSVNAGIQTWEVPLTGTYSFSIAGASGGDGGLAATISGSLSLQGGSHVVFVIGQVGLAASTHLDGKAGHDHDGLGGGGGGATYIFADSFATPLMVAGGGAGTGGNASPVNDTGAPAGGAGGPVYDPLGESHASPGADGQLGSGGNGGALGKKLHIVVAPGGGGGGGGLGTSPTSTYEGGAGGADVSLIPGAKPLLGEDGGFGGGGGSGAGSKLSITELVAHGGGGGGGGGWHGGQGGGISAASAAPVVVDATGGTSFVSGAVTAPVIALAATGGPGMATVVLQR